MIARRFLLRTVANARAKRREPRGLEQPDVKSISHTICDWYRLSAVPGAMWHAACL